MLIILEGNECCFKTTVAEKLSKQLNIPIIKGSSFEFSQCTNEELFKRFKELAELDNVIIDRFIYSNQVYATLYDDFAILTDEQRHYIEDMIRHKSRVYYLFADNEVIEERITQRGDDYVDVSMVKKINEFYSEIMLDAMVRVISYDTNDWNSDEIVEELVGDFKNN